MRTSLNILTAIGVDVRFVFNDFGRIFLRRIRNSTDFTRV